jgi:hypothetical protein
LKISHFPLHHIGARSALAANLSLFLATPVLQFGASVGRALVLGASISCSRRPLLGLLGTL